MSSTGRSESRRKDDFYSTPPYCVDCLLSELRPDVRLHVCEPTAGSGAIVRRLLNYGFTSIDAIEIDSDRARRLFEFPVCVQVGDACKLKPMFVPKLTIGNPPFSEAQRIIEAALEWTQGPVAMLLRLGFIGPECRSEFLSEHPPDIWILDRRPSFVSNVRWSVGYHQTGPDGKKKFHRIGDPTYIKEQAEKLLSSLPKSKQELKIRKTKVCNDSSEYAWFIWGLPGGGGRWRILQTRKR